MFRDKPSRIATTNDHSGLWVWLSISPTSLAPMKATDYGLCFYTLFISLSTFDMAYSAIYEPLHFGFDLWHCLDIRYLTAMVKFLSSGFRRQNESVSNGSCVAE